MKAIFGVVSLLLVLAILGMLAVKQLGAARHAVSDVSSGAGVASTPAAASGNVAQQSRQLQEQVKNDVAKALEQGAAARRDDADK